MTTNQIVITTDNRQTDLSLIWNGAFAQAEAAMTRLWAKLRAEWLRTYKSKATRRTYETATDQWLDYLSTQLDPNGQPVQPWAIDAGHVRGWLQTLEAAASAPATINQRLAACSSWYSFVINERHLVDGIERSAFFDAAGNTRANPFHAHNIQRPEATAFRQARPLTTDQIGRILATCNQETINGSRNFALILTTFLTGWRVAEAISMEWGRIEQHRSLPGRYTYNWKGKGGKTNRDALPAPAYHAILHHLRQTGRIPAGTLIEPGVDNDYIRPPEYIFTPLDDRAAANLTQFKTGDKLDPDRHISPQSANRILRSALKKAGLPVNHRIHDLRHSLAHAHYETFKDVKAVQMLLHHSSSAVTDRYLKELSDPIDTHGENLYQQVMSFS